jgi:hypothetical protein
MISILTVTIEGVTSCAPAILGLGAVFRLALNPLAEAGIAGARLLHFLCRLSLKFTRGGTFFFFFSLGILYLVILIDCNIFMFLI